jgi:hypothetical protein
MQYFPNQVNLVKPSFSYYSFKYTNTGQTYENASYNLAKVFPVLRHSNKYLMSVVKLTVSTNAIPRMYSYINSFLTGNVDPNQTIWSVGLNYGGKFVDVFIEHVSQGSYAVPNNLSASNPYQDLSPTYQPYYKIDSIQHFVDMMNTALTSAFTQLQGYVAPALAGTTAPQFIFNRDTGFIDLQADYNFYGPQVGTPVQVFMNPNLKAIMRNYNYYENLALGGFFQFLFRNEDGDTTNTYCRQECVQLDQFSNAFVELAVSSSSMGVKPTFSDGGADIGQENQIEAQSLTQSRSLITSFSVQEDPSANSQRIRTTYVPSGQYRYFSIENSNAINNIDLQITYKDIYQNEFYLILPPGGFIDLLIQFARIEE